jgi:hypothetical protein
MNWRRGLFRLWLVLSLCWIVAVSVYAWKQEPWMLSLRVPACFEAKRAAGANPFNCFDVAEGVRLREASVRLADIAAAAKEYAVYAFLPPLIALVLGLSGAWMVSGFARKGASVRRARSGADGVREVMEAEVGHFSDAADIPALGPDVIAVIHENIGIVMTYAFSREALKEFRSRHHGEWENLDYGISVLPRKRANRACIELALMLRSLDEALNIGQYEGDLGRLYDKSGQSSPLPLREVLNKIIHAKSIEWDFTRPNIPVIVCEASKRQVERHGWTKAEIRIDTLGTVCGMFATPM